MISGPADRSLPFKWEKPQGDKGPRTGFGQGQAGSKPVDAATEKKLLKRIRTLILTIILPFFFF